MGGSHLNREGTLERVVWKRVSLSDLVWRAAAAVREVVRGCEGAGARGRDGSVAVLVPVLVA